MTLLPVPHRQQIQLADCLPACVAMVLDYIGYPMRYEVLLKRLGTRPYGTVTRNVLRLADNRLSVEYRESGLAEVRAFIDHGIPVIALVRTGELPHWSYDTLHSIVIVGYDEARLYANDPALDTALVAVPESDFDLAWLAMDNKCVVLRAQYQ